LVGPLAIDAGVDLFVPFTRDQFGVESVAGSVFQESSVAGAASVGLALSIP
jgi:hypothetical protein